MTATSLTLIPRQMPAARTPNIPSTYEIPLVIGVTGHRRLKGGPDMDAVRLNVRETLLEIVCLWRRAHNIPPLPTTGPARIAERFAHQFRFSRRTATQVLGQKPCQAPKIILLTALAAGADQLVADEAWKINQEQPHDPPIDIRVPLPMPFIAYEKVLGPDASAQLRQLISERYATWYELPFAKKRHV